MIPAVTTFIMLVLILMDFHIHFVIVDFCFEDIEEKEKKKKPLWFPCRRGREDHSFLVHI